MSKSSLAIYLSKLERFSTAKLKLEQYETDPEIAAEVLWHAYMLGDVEGKTIADLGAGTGILSAGVLKLGAKHATLVEKDSDVLSIARRNLEKTGDDWKLVHSDISEFDEKVDVVVQNPPFGTREKHADKVFLEKAFVLADVVYSFHKESTASFVEAIAADKGFDITHHWSFEFPLKQTQKHHTRKIHRIAVGCWRMEKNKKK
ncbi:METTL5 family protein [Thermoproteota archaeon]